MPYLIIEHPAYIAGEILATRWYVHCAYPDGTHCDIDVLDDDGNIIDLIGGTLLDGEYTYDYIYAHYKPHIQIGEVE